MLFYSSERPPALYRLPAEVVTLARCSLTMVGFLVMLFFVLYCFAMLFARGSSGAGAARAVGPQSESPPFGGFDPSRC